MLLQSLLHTERVLLGLYCTYIGKGVSLTLTPMVDARIERVKSRLLYSGCLQHSLSAALSLFFFILPSGLYIGLFFFLMFGFNVATVKFGLGRWFESPPKRAAKSLDDFQIMFSRHSCRSFQARRLSRRDLNELLEYTREQCDGTSSKLIDDQGVRFEYVSAPIKVWPAVGASEFLVALAPRAYNPLAVIDVGRRLQKVVIKATRMGLGTCWIGPGANQESVTAGLGEHFNPDEDHVICVCAIGYESRFWPLLLTAMTVPTSNIRLPYSDLLFSDQHFREPLKVRSQPYKRFQRCYKVCRWSPSSLNAQTTRMAAIMRSGRLSRFDFATTTKSRYYAPVALGIWCGNWEVGCQTLGIPGHFEVLTTAERDCEDGSSKLPRYYVSWVLDDVKSE